MGRALRDDNRVTTGLGVSSADEVTPLNFYIDSVTNRVLLSLHIVSNSVGTVTDAPAKRDDNRVATVLCKASDDTVLAIPAIDSRNSNLYLDIVVE